MKGVSVTLGIKLYLILLYKKYTYGHLKWHKGLSSYKMELMIWVQTLNKSIGVSPSINALWKWYESNYCLPPL